MKLFVYCGGGFGREVFDTALRINRVRRKWDEILFIDDYAESGSGFYGTRVFTFADVLERFDVDGYEVTIANGEPVHRRTIFERVAAHGVQFATIVDETAIISDTAILGKGVIITAYCSVSSQAVIGENVAVNTKSIVGHDVRLGNHAVISSMVNIGGASSIGDNSYVGMGVSIKEGLVIGKDVIVGMGSVVHNDIPDEVIALGNPARPMRQNMDKRVFKKAG
jgi:sugar O-acyltransferase (sialic acid O-acetyltransferase NeuD family)